MAMSASARLVRAARAGLLRPLTRPTATIEPCRLLCIIPAEPHRAPLCSSTPRATPEERGPLYSRSNKSSRQSPDPQRVTGTWERPSDFSRPRSRRRAEEEEEEEEGYHHAEKSSGGRPGGTAREVASGPRAKAAVAAVVLAAVAFYAWNSQTVPLTGRWRFNFLSDEMAERMHPGAVQSILRQVYESGGWILGDGDARTRIVKRVMRRLILVSGLADLDWEIYVIADDSRANAFVLPGGKVFVFSGLLRVCGNEDALAAVLGHEVAHQTASHTAERLSQAWVGSLTAGSLFFLVGVLPGLALFAMWTATGAFVLPTLMYELPMSRAHEYEADHIGLMMMAEACYDPRAAIPFWRRMSESDQDEVLSTHPSNEHRVAKLTQLMPVALAKREQSDCRGTESFARRFRLAVKRRQREMPRPEEM